MNDILSNAVKKWRQSSFVWGESDCLISLADYLVELGYDDFASEYRGQYHTEQQAAKTLYKIGLGYSELIKSTGLPETETPERGDIVLVCFGQSLAGICTGEGVVFRNARTVSELDLKRLNVKKCWKVTKCHN